MLVQGVGFAAVLIGWLVVRAHRTRPPVQNGAGRGVRLATGAGLVALAVMAGLVAGPLLPGTDTDDRREVVRTSLVPPLDVSQFPSPLPGFRRYTEPNPAELYDKEVLRVQGLPEGALVRFATLDAYDGLVWGAADRSSDGVPFQQVGSRISAVGDGDPVTVTVDVVEGGYAGHWLPTVGSPTEVEFTGPRADELAEELWLNTDTSTAVVPRSLLGGERYTMSALLPASPVTALPEDLDVAGGASSSEDVDLLDARIDAWTSRAEGAWGKLRAVANQMRTEGTYTDGGTPNSFEKVYLPGHALARLGRFVNSTKLAGNDEQYAATLALAGQRLGIPSRVVMGADPATDGSVRGRDVHAWVEVRLDDGSWFPLAASTFVPSRDKTPSEQQLKTEEQKVGAQVPPPAGVNPPSLLQGPDQAQNATDITKRKKNPFDVGAWPLWLRVLVLGVVVPLLLAAAYVALRAVAQGPPPSSATRAPGHVPARAAWVWRDLMAEARSLGVAVPRRATRREQAVVVRPRGRRCTARGRCRRLRVRTRGRCRGCLRGVRRPGPRGALGPAGTHEPLGAAALRRRPAAAVRPAGSSSRRGPRAVDGACPASAVAPTPRRPPDRRAGAPGHHVEAEMRAGGIRDVSDAARPDVARQRAVSALPRRG